MLDVGSWFGGTEATDHEADAMLQEANWSRSSSCWDMSQFKRPSDTLAASSGFGLRSMIAS
jgi:hypothetical protein